MTRIGLLSDTHNFFDPRFIDIFKEVDEIWHAGDIGDIKVLDELRKIKPVRAVYGNIDSSQIRTELQENLRFKCDDVDVWITHIGGYPKKYSHLIKKELFRNPPKLLISGHSHILKVIFDDKLNLLYINPGAAGRSGFHKVRTVIRFSLDKGDIKNLEIIELK